MEKWFVLNKKADFNALGKRFGISPVTARLIRNRDITDEQGFKQYLNGEMEDLYDPHLLKGVEKLTDVLVEKINEKKRIQIIGDYDIDGVMATYLLYKGLLRCGGVVSVQIPDRMKDGYGLNEHLIEKAREDAIDTIITCDNGIAAVAEIALAKKFGMTVLITDHHEIPFIEECGEKKYVFPDADAIVNPKQPDCKYPYKNLCGAAVAWKVLQVLYEKCRIPVQEADEFLENVAFATVGDVMDLKDENRILVKEGLKRLRCTQNPGMKALISQNGLEAGKINSYHIGFVLGPCINASGRLDTAKRSLNLFLEPEMEKATALAAELFELNAERKNMTIEGTKKATREVEEHYKEDRVLVVYLPDVHESLAGIIAGRIRELYYKPVFILTKGEEEIKGSGRSIEEYSMYEELCKCRELFTKFGGHPMAAGLSIAKEEDIAKFREKINACCKLTEEDLTAKVKIDIAMPVGYPDMALIREFDLLEPFGKGNVRPQFADRNLTIQRAFIVGKNQNVLRLQLGTEYNERISAVYFGDIEAFQTYYAQKYGSEEVKKAFSGSINKIKMQVVYYPDINVYNGNESVQIVIRSYQ